MTLPVYAIVSTDIRRDLVKPLRHFTRLRIAHLYRRVSYGDLAADEFDDNLSAYTSPLDLLRRLWRVKPDVVQGVEPFSTRLLPYLYSVWTASRLQRVPLIVVTLENRPLADRKLALLSRAYALLVVGLGLVSAYAVLR